MPAKIIWIDRAHGSFLQTGYRDAGQQQDHRRKIMDIAALTALLTPAIPFLVKGGEKLAEMAAEKIGNTAPELVKKIWQRLQGAIDKSPAAKELVADLANSPDNRGFQIALESQLEKILAADQDLAQQIAELIQQAGPSISQHAEVHGSGAIAQGEHAVAAGQGGVAVGGDVHGRITLGGSHKD